MYLWHPHEPKLWFLLFLLTVGLRLYPLYDASSFRPFEGSTSVTDVWSMTRHHCSLELDLLCHDPKMFQCVDQMGFSIAPFLGGLSEDDDISDKELGVSRNCTLLDQNKILDIQLSNMPLEEREKEILVRVMATTIVRLYHVLVFQSEQIQHRFVDFYIRKFFCLFGNIQRETVADSGSETLFYQSQLVLSDSRVWTPEEFFRLLSLSTEQALSKLQNDKDDEIDHNKISISLITMTKDSIIVQKRPKEKDVMAYIALVRSVQQILHPLVFQSERSDGRDLVCQLTASVPKDDPYNFKGRTHVLGSWELNTCILQYYHSDNNRLILSENCAKALEEAPIKIEELAWDGKAGFQVATHLFFFGVNLVSCLVVFSLLTSQQRLETRLDRGRERLEEELSDPVLRKALEHKAKMLPNEEGRDLVLRLDAKITSWDSKEAATRLLRRHLHNFRLMVLFSMSLTTVAYSLLHVFHLSSLPRYLEVMSMSFGMLTISYVGITGDNLKVPKGPPPPNEKTYVVAV